MISHFLRNLKPRPPKEDLDAPFPSRIRPGTILMHQYRVGERVGRGGQGRVYYGEDFHLDRPVAIKEARPGDLEALKHEFLMLQDASSSEVVPQPYEVIDEYASSFLIMEWVNGVTLQAYVEQLRWLSLPTSLAILIQCCESLERLHATQVMHCDLKPSNVLLAPRGVIFVDLGIARVHGETLPVMGTPGYIAPEQWAGHPCLASDTYSLEATFRYVLAHVDLCLGEAAVVELIVEDLLPRMRHPLPGRRLSLELLVTELQRLTPSIKRR